MAEEIHAAIIDNNIVVAEAGTGTGKTFAYLVPALISLTTNNTGNSKVLLSTGTKNLQDQLYHRDLPRVRKALGLPIKTALLKGRSNYLCQHRLDLTEKSGDFYNKGQQRDFRNIINWAGRTRKGDKAEVAEVSDRSSIWPRVTSTVDNCLGQECPDISECFVNQARREAQDAEIIVVNHHLFLADLNLREDGFGELLPDVDTIIFDEAHQLPELAPKFFSTAITGYQLLELVRDSIAEELKETGDIGPIENAAKELEKSVRHFWLALGSSGQRQLWQNIDQTAQQLSKKVASVIRSLSTLQKELAELPIESCQKRVNELQAKFKLLTAKAPAEQVHWFETNQRNFSINHTPLDISEQFKAVLQERAKSWIFVSATLAVKNNFNHFTSAIGLEDAITKQWHSPFDFPKQSLLFHPPYLPEPSDPLYDEQMLQAVLPVLTASQGRSFFLFTSHRALKFAAWWLEENSDFTLMIQGSAPRDELVRQFRESDNGVLLGAASFWEGVDVRGDDLSCVVIDRLPFASPGDPVVNSKIETMRQAGGNPFYDYQLPNAVLTLKQGAGRLIRDEDDRGVLVICDPRIIRKSYGQTFINSLPNMQRTRVLSDILNFFAS